MKTRILSLTLLVTAGSLAAAAGNAIETRITGKVYVAETQGISRIVSAGRVFAPAQASSFEARGVIIETEAAAHDSFVLSNGTGMYVGGNSRIKIERFDQEPFAPDRNTLESEPSVSTCNVQLLRGTVGLCSSARMTGSTMTYVTPQASIEIRGQRITLSAAQGVTIVSVLAGEAGIEPAGSRRTATVARSGEQAVIRDGAPGEPPSISIEPIDETTQTRMERIVGLACTARRTVSFETTGLASDRDAFSGAGPEIVARPAVPANLPPNIVVSPDRLPGTE